MFKKNPPTKMFLVMQSFLGKLRENKHKIPIKLQN